jgi:hypothetical protein
VEYLTIQIIYLYFTLFAVVIVGLVIVIEVVVEEFVAVAVVESKLQQFQIKIRFQLHLSLRRGNRTFQAEVCF